jgi:hypothetical protein
MTIETDELGIIISSTPDKNDLGGTPADGDNSYDIDYAARVAAMENNATATGSDEVETINKSFGGQTQSGQAQKPAGNIVVDKRCWQVT